MLENSERYPLQHILVEDIFSSNKLIVILLLLILASAMGTIWMTHQTRGLISENGQLVLQHQALETNIAICNYKKQPKVIIQELNPLRLVH